MRRKDREVTDSIKIEQTVKDCSCCRLGFADEGEVYIVPMNFGYEKNDDKYIFYFHCAGRGRKIDLIKRTHRACIEMDTGYRLNTGKEACDYSCAFRSIIGNGSIDIINDIEEKKKGLNLIMRQATGKDDWNYPEAALKEVTLLKLTAESLSCKEHE